MALNSAIDSKEDGPDIPKSKSIENTVNNPEENPSLTSIMSDSSLEANIPPQIVVTWMMVSVAVGLLTIYTIIQLISNKLTQKIDNGKEVNHHYENTTDLSNHPEDKHNGTDCDNDLQTPQEQSDDKGHETAKGSDSDLLFKQLMSSEDGSLNAKNGDFGSSGNVNVEELETNGSHMEHTECTECQSNGCITSIHMGAGFSGNVSISSEISAEESVCSKTNSNAAENALNCRSAATLENCNVHHSTPVTVSHLQAKCFSYNARNTEVPAHPMKHISASNKLCNTTNCSQQVENYTGTKLENKMSAENKNESPNNHPACTIACMQTTVKSLSCAPCNDVAELQLADLNKPEEILQSCFHPNFGLEDTLNPHEIAENRINEADIPFEAGLLHTTQSNACTENKSPTKTVSDSLTFLANDHSPQETIDGAIFSKTQDEFMFPQDNATEKQFTTKEETPRSRYLRLIREDPALSKSLDSQMEILKKGCKLLEKKPAKSALKTSGSEESLKKFVHFPADIRHIRTVHKYDSFDESRFDDVQDSANKKQRTQSQSFDIFLRK